MTQVTIVQSRVVHGHVGDSAAVFPKQAKEIEAVAAPTRFSPTIPIIP